MRVVGVRVELPQNQPILLLRETEGERYLPIWIGSVEATAIALEQQGVRPARPLTHDLLKDVIGALGRNLEQVRITADQILRTGEARYPVIGAKVETGRSGDGTGARIDEVMPDTPADASGLEQGDVITAVNGKRVTDGISLIVAIRTYRPGETIEFTVLRDGDEQVVPITLGSEVG